MQKVVEEPTIIEEPEEMLSEEEEIEAFERELEEEENRALEFSEPVDFVVSPDLPEIPQ